MSTNRSVQAAQRRRAGPSEPQQINRGPATSINSAQMFANQVKPGNGPNIPNGRIAGQQAAYSQQQMMQQQQQQQQEKDPNFSKLTIAQAITLITLRLGAVETKLIEMEHNGGRQFSSLNSDLGVADNNLVQIDKNQLSSIMNRLESLEKRSPLQNVGSPDLTLIKQQVEAMKPAVVQSKNAIVNLMKTNESLKSDIDNLRSEMVDIKNSMESVVNLTMEHEKSLNNMLFGSDVLGQDMETTIQTDQSFHNEEIIENVIEQNIINNDDSNVNNNSNNIDNLDYSSLTENLDLGLNVEDLKNISFSFTE